jgi:hypothetical protein
MACRNLGRAKRLVNPRKDGRLREREAKWWVEGVVVRGSGGVVVVMGWGKLSRVEGVFARVWGGGRGRVLGWVIARTEIETAKWREGVVNRAEAPSVVSCSVAE